jgi:hypothetical protein
MTSNVIDVGNPGLGAPGGVGGAGTSNGGQSGVNGVANTIGVCVSAGAC